MYNRAIQAYGSHAFWTVGPNAAQRRRRRTIDALPIVAIIMQNPPGRAYDKHVGPVVAPYAEQLVGHLRIHNFP